jgi:hypothetical protein
MLKAVVSLTRGDIMELRAINRQDAANFIEKSLIRRDLPHDSATVSVLLDELECLPLAISQAATHLKMNRMPITQYLNLLRNREQDGRSLMSRDLRNNMRYEGEAAGSYALRLVAEIPVPTCNEPFHEGRLPTQNNTNKSSK